MDLGDILAAQIKLKPTLIFGVNPNQPDMNQFVARDFFT